MRLIPAGGGERDVPDDGGGVRVSEAVISIPAGTRSESTERTVMLGGLVSRSFKTVTDFEEFGDPIVTEPEAGSRVTLTDPDPENARPEASYKVVTVEPDGGMRRRSESERN